MGITPVHFPVVKVMSSIAMSPRTPFPIWASIVNCNKYGMINSLCQIYSICICAHVLLNLLNKFRRIISARFAEHFITFCNLFNKFNILLIILNL